MCVCSEDTEGRRLHSDGQRGQSELRGQKQRSGSEGTVGRLSLILQGDSDVNYNTCCHHLQWLKEVWKHLRFKIGIMQLSLKTIIIFLLNG